MRSNTICMSIPRFSGSPNSFLILFFSRIEIVAPGKEDIRKWNMIYLQVSYYMHIFVRLLNSFWIYTWFQFGIDVLTSKITNKHFSQKLTDQKLIKWIVPTTKNIRYSRIPIERCTFFHKRNQIDIMNM